MGYYTHYYIKAIDLKPAADRPVLNAAFFNSLELYDTAADEKPWVKSDKGRYSFGDGEAVKWYDSDSEIAEVSANHQDIVFILDGEGEESGDIWRKFFLNGKLIHEWEPEISPPEWGDIAIGGDYLV